MRIFAAVNLRFQGQGSSFPVEAGAKARPKGVVDAQQVDIPAPLANCNSCVGWLAYSHEEMVVDSKDDHESLARSGETYTARKSELR